MKMFIKLFFKSIAYKKKLWYKPYKEVVVPMSEKKKKIEVINGDGKDLDISQVYDHIKSDNPPNDENKRKNIVIPKGKHEQKK